MSEALLHELQHAVNPQERREFHTLYQECANKTGLEINQIVSLLSAQQKNNTSTLAAYSEENQEIVNRQYTTFGSEMTQYAEQIVVSRVNPTMEAFFGEARRTGYYYKEGDEYTLSSSIPTALYHENPSKNVNEAITEVLFDIQLDSIDEDTSSFTQKIEEERKNAQKDFPDGNGLYF